MATIETRLGFASDAAVSHVSPCEPAEETASSKVWSLTSVHDSPAGAALRALFLVLPRRRTDGPQRDGLRQQVIEFLRSDWFRKIPIHACRKTPFTVAFHGVCGQGDDRNMQPFS